MTLAGIVRRIDDLGRVVVPKEIRRTLRIREGDPLEIFTDREGEIILKKYSPIGELSQFARDYAEALGQATGHIVLIMDKDQMSATSAGNRKELLGKTVSREFENLLEQREVLQMSNAERGFVAASEGLEDVDSQIVAPILAEGDIIGAVMVVSKDAKNKVGETERKLVTSAANFLGKQMEG